MKKTHVHILSTVNTALVSKEAAGGMGGRQETTYTIRGVCGAVDGIVMNGALYPADFQPRRGTTAQPRGPE